MGVANCSTRAHQIHQNKDTIQEQKEQHASVVRAAEVYLCGRGAPKDDVLTRAWKAYKGWYNRVNLTPTEELDAGMYACMYVCMYVCSHVFM
jgi:hypothetical protein